LYYITYYIAKDNPLILLRGFED